MKGEETIIVFRDFKNFNKDHFLQDIVSFEAINLEKYSNPNQI